MIAGDKKWKARITDAGASVPYRDVSRGWHQNVGPMERTERIHGHVVGLRMVSCRCICSY